MGDLILYHGKGWFMYNYLVMMTFNFEGATNVSIGWVGVKYNN